MAASGENQSKMMSKFLYRDMAPDVPRPSPPLPNFRPEINSVPFVHFAVERYFQQLPKPWPAWHASVAQNVKAA